MVSSVILIWHLYLQPYSLTALQPYSFTALQLYCLIALQPYCLTALQGYMQDVLCFSAKMKL
ncbi:hypothetical protein CXF72_00745 [Psychromonas sp. MB-3u-54]|nr:hypothetical protein CXF72_00745 [Psychromonas sp. MB-3u-54]